MKEAYRVAFRKKGAQRETYVSVNVSSVENLYSAICGIANVSDTMELEFLEIHRIKPDNTVEVFKQPETMPTAVPQKPEPYPLYVKARPFNLISMKEAGA